MNDKIIISICGAAGTGKSTLTKKLVTVLGRDMSTRIPTDYYLKSYNGEPLEEFISTPFRYDWALLKKVFVIPIGVGCETPMFDFNKSIRLDKSGGTPFTTKRYMVLDSMLPYPDSNYVIKLEAPADLRLKRIKERDRAQKTKSARYWDKMEVTAKELESGKYRFDLKLNGMDEDELNAEKVAEFLNLSFTGRQENS